MARFRLFLRHEEVAASWNRPAAQELYELLGRLRRAALDEESRWSGYSGFRDYASIIFWAMRKLEYSFAAEQFALIENEAERPLDVLDVGSGVVPLCNWISMVNHF